MDARAWDERYAAAPLLWSAGPNALFAELTEDLPPGRALDLAAGEGRTALWLASRGWTVTAVDFSGVALDKGRVLSERAGVTVDWVRADVTEPAAIRGSYDLVAVLYLHLAEKVIRDVLRRAVDAVAPGGRLVLIGHDRDNISHGTGGPQDPAILYTTELLADWLGDLEVRRLEQVPRPVGEQTAIDTLLVATARDAG